MAQITDNTRGLEGKWTKRTGRDEVDESSVFLLGGEGIRRTEEESNAVGVVGKGRASRVNMKGHVVLAS